MLATQYEHSIVVPYLTKPKSNKTHTQLGRKKSRHTQFAAHFVANLYQIHVTMKNAAKAAISPREPSKRTRKPSAVALSATPTRVSTRRRTQNKVEEKTEKKKLKEKPTTIVEKATVVVGEALPKKRGRKPKEKPVKETNKNGEENFKPKEIIKLKKVEETNNNVSLPPPPKTRIEAKIRGDVAVLDLTVELEKSGRSLVKNKKYRCEICDKNFLGSNDLRKHLRIHR